MVMAPAEFVRFFSSFTYFLNLSRSPLFIIILDAYHHITVIQHGKKFNRTCAYMHNFFFGRWKEMAQERNVYAHA